MEFGIIFWSVIAYSLITPVVIRFTIMPLLHSFVTKRADENGEIALGRVALTLLFAIAGSLFIISGPLTWARQMQRLIPEDAPEKA